MFKNAKQVGMVVVKHWINFWSFNVISHRLDGDDDDAEPPDASVGGSTDDVTQSSRGQNDSGPCNIHVWTYSCGESTLSLSLSLTDKWILDLY